MQVPAEDEVPLARLDAIEDAREVAQQQPQAGRAVDQRGAALVVVGLERARCEAAEVDARAARLDARRLVAQEPHRRAVQVGQRDRRRRTGRARRRGRGCRGRRRRRAARRAGRASGAGSSSPDRRARRSPVMTTRSGSAPPDQVDAVRQRPSVQSRRADVEVGQVSDPEPVEAPGRGLRSAPRARLDVHPLGLEETPPNTGRGDGQQRFVAFIRGVPFSRDE